MSAWTWFWFGFAAASTLYFVKEVIEFVFSTSPETAAANLRAWRDVLFGKPATKD